MVIKKKAAGPNDIEEVIHPLSFARMINGVLHNLRHVSPNIEFTDAALISIHGLMTRVMTGLVKSKNYHRYLSCLY